MIKSKFKSLLSFNGVSLIIGIAGGIFGFVSPFITDWNEAVSLKWFLLMIFIFFILVLGLIKVLFDIREDLKKKSVHYIRVVRYIPNHETFIITNNDTLGNDAMVSLFYLDENFEVEFGKGYVENIQEKFTQVKLLILSKEFEREYSLILKQLRDNNVDVLKKIIVKSYIKYSKN